MKFCFFVVTSVCSFASLAGIPHYKLDMAFSQDGKVVNTPHIVVAEGQMAIVKEKMDGHGEESFIEVTASAKSRKAVALYFTIGKFINGERVITAQPKVVTNFGEAAGISSASMETGHECGLSVTAEPVTLE